MGRLDIFSAVTADPFLAQVIEHNEEDVWPGGVRAFLGPEFHGQGAGDQTYRSNCV